MADQQGISTLKLRNRNKVPFYPADWITGVDYNNENDKNDEDASQFNANADDYEVEYEDDNEIKYAN